MRIFVVIFVAIFVIIFVVVERRYYGLLEKNGEESIAILVNIRLFKSNLHYLNLDPGKKAAIFSILGCRFKYLLHQGLCLRYAA